MISNVELLRSQGPRRIFSFCDVHICFQTELSPNSWVCAVLSTDRLSRFAFNNMESVLEYASGDKEDFEALLESNELEIDVVSVGYAFR